MTRKPTSRGRSRRAIKDHLPGTLTCQERAFDLVVTRSDDTSDAHEKGTCPTASGSLRSGHAYRIPVIRGVTTMDKLTREQAARLLARVRPMLGFLYRCRRRLDERSYDHESKIYKVIDAAYCAVHSLSVELHYASLARGVGKPADEDHD